MKEENQHNDADCVKQGPEGRTWKFVSDKSFSWRTDRFGGRNCEFKWLKIEDNLITVKASPSMKYAWDGNTPKKNILDLTLGTPDGMLIKHDNGEYHPITYYAYMVHDAIYQYKRCVPMTRKETDLIYLDMLRHVSFKLRPIYYVAVRAGGTFLGPWPYKP